MQMHCPGTGELAVHSCVQQPASGLDTALQRSPSTSLMHMVERSYQRCDEPLGSGEPAHHAQHGIPHSLCARPVLRQVGLQSRGGPV